MSEGFCLMCYAGNCHPDCDNCKPKYVYCPHCAARLLIAQKTCHLCGEALSEAVRLEAVERWKSTHIGKDPGSLDALLG